MGRLDMRNQGVRVEDYLIAIERLCVSTGSELAKSGQIAKSLGVSTGYVSTTLARLANEGLIIHQPHEGAKLTDLGRTRAMRFVRRLSITELLLASLLKWEPESTAAEAHQLEPAMSEKLIDALDRFLGYPEFDRKGADSTVSRFIPKLHSWAGINRRVMRWK